MILEPFSSNMQLLESEIKHELIEKSQLVRALPNCEEIKPSLSEPLNSVSIACGAPVFEVWMKVPSWAAQVAFLLTGLLIHFQIYFSSSVKIF